MTTLRVGLVGRGAIGDVIAHGILTGAGGNSTLTGVVRRLPVAADEVGTIGELLELGCDLVVEAAGRDAVIEGAGPVLSAGVDFMILSTGALADRETERAIRGGGPGRVLISTGAIGGIDIIKAMHASGSLRQVSIASTTVPGALVNSVDRDEAEVIVGLGRETKLFGGTARQVARRYPQVANVAATLALATLGLDEVRAELWVDPAGRRKRHAITAIGDTSRLDVTIVNELSASNPRTSAVTPFAVLRYLKDRDADLVVGV